MVTPIINLHIINIISRISNGIGHRTNDQYGSMYPVGACTITVLLERPKLVSLDACQLAVLLLGVILNCHVTCHKLLISGGSAAVTTLVTSSCSASSVLAMAGTVPSAVSTPARDSGEVARGGSGVLKCTLPGVICELCLDGREVRHHSPL